VAALAAYSAIQGDLAATLRFFFSFDLAHMKPEVALEALGLGFFSIGVGLCTMITYAAYAGSEINLKQVAIFIVVSDTTISLLAGFAVFPVVFAENLDPASGPGLVFITLPVAFARMPFGTLAAVAFFMLLAVAAIGSAISLLELAVAPVRNALGWPQARATVVCASVCWIVGLATVLSFNHWAAWFPFAIMPKFATSTMFDLIDYLTSNLLLPIGGFGIAIFIGWATPQWVLTQELELSAGAARFLRVLLRYFVPILIGAATLAPFA
jgi:neurotransmitter:Na+ symporter, NSS family